MAKIIHFNEVPRDLKYERGLKIDFGVNDGTVGSTLLTMGHTIVPPGSRNQRHYHKCDACFYVIKGRIKVLLLDGKDYYEREAGPGNFCYAGPGEIHGLINLSDTEEAELVFAYGGVPNRTAAGTTFVDQPEVVDNHLAAKGIKLAA